MFELIKSVISAGGYKLAEIQHKIKKMYFYNDLTEAQMDELLALAAGGNLVARLQGQIAQGIRADDLADFLHRVVGSDQGLPLGHVGAEVAHIRKGR